MADQSNRTIRLFIHRLPPIVLVLLHQVIGTVGTIILSGIICDALFGLTHTLVPSTRTLRASWFLTEVSGFPVQVSLGLAAGFAITRLLPSRFAVWVWVLPFVFFCFGAMLVAHPVGSRLNYMFGDTCKPAEGCFYQILFTLPFLASTGYASGAAMARQRGTT